jgi:predicted esterase
VGLALCVVPLLHAQLSEKPETWTKVEGQYVIDADRESVLFLMAQIQAAQADPAPGRKLHPEVGEAMQMAYQALSVANWNAAARLFARVLAVYRDQPPGEWLEVASSLQFEVDRRIAAPGATLHGRLEPRFVLGRPLKTPYRVQAVLLDAQGKTVVERPAETLQRLEPVEFSIRTNGLPEGAYQVRYQLVDSEGKVRAWATRDVLLSPSMEKRIHALVDQGRKLAAAGVALKSAAHALAVQTVQFLGSLYSQALEGPGPGLANHLSPLAQTLADPKLPNFTTEPVNPSRDLPMAEWMAGELLSGNSPLAVRKGDLRLAYLSAVDQTLQSFRLFLPPGYDASRKWPLLVLLHDAGGDEGSYFEKYPAQDGGSQVMKLASERGYVVAAPSGRGPMEYYTNVSRKDVLDVVDRVKECFSIDGKQVFLAGHGTGAGGVMSVSMGEPGRFAALMAVGGQPLEALDFSKAPDVPLLFVQGGADEIFSLTTARRLAFVLQRRYKQFEYVEDAPSNHAAVGVTSLTMGFDFFDAVRAGKWKPSGKPLPLPSYPRN